MNYPLVKLLNSETDFSAKKLVLSAGMSGIANAIILTIINNVAATENGGTDNVINFLLFFVAIAVYVLCLKYSYDISTRLFESMIHHIRVRVAEKICQAKLIKIERLGFSELYNGLSQNTSTISLGQLELVAALQSAILIVFVGIYIALLSFWALVVVVVGVWFGMLIYWKNKSKIIQVMNASIDKQGEFFFFLEHLILGFKELKMNNKRSQRFIQALNDNSLELRDLSIIYYSIYNINSIFSQSFYYLLIAAVVFLLPQFAPENTQDLTKITAAILFSIGPISRVVSSFPIFSRCNTAAENIIELERKLDESAINDSSSKHSFIQNKDYSIHNKDYSTDKIIRPNTEGRLELMDVVYRYYDDDQQTLYQIGPLNLTVDCGEILYIVGGNGSGKSTLMKVLTGLYQPYSGRICYGGLDIDASNAESYRQLFSIVFTDFHLFNKLYDVDDSEQDNIQALLKKLAMETKTQFINGGFQYTKLSTGQRKRLALLVAMLEDRPIMVLDEWAADQDPQFRQFFYEELLAELKQQGKTIIAVTHDDRYFNTGDRVIKMDYGKIVPFKGL